VACKVCSSENQQRFAVESAVAFPGVQRLNLVPVYVCQRTLVCLDCGFMEYKVPARGNFVMPKGLDMEPIFAFPKLTVCLDCGSIQSDLSAKELDNIKESTKKFVAVLSNGAAVTHVT
jgi:hypothetical protein